MKYLKNIRFASILRESLNYLEIIVKIMRVLALVLAVLQAVSIFSKNKKVAR